MYNKFFILLLYSGILIGVDQNKKKSYLCDDGNVTYEIRLRYYNYVFFVY